MARTATGARPSVHLAAGTNFSTEGTAAGTMLITNVMEPLGGSFVGTGACSIAEDTTLAETCNLRNLRNLLKLLSLFNLSCDSTTINCSKRICALARCAVFEN